MKEEVLQLIPYIIREIEERGGSVTKTKLLKLLYLFDISYYRKNRKIFTDFKWVYLHFGPWTNEYDDILDRLAGDGTIKRQVSSTGDHEVEFLSTKKELVSDEFLEGSGNYLALRGVLNKWGLLSLNPILDYIYFQTEPMLQGVRYQPLDFSTIGPEPPAQYKRSSSNTTPKRLKELRLKVASIFEEAKKMNQIQKYDPPAYGEVFYRGMEALDRLD